MLKKIRKTKKASRKAKVVRKNEESGVLGYLGSLFMVLVVVLMSSGGDVSVDADRSDAVNGGEVELDEVAEEVVAGDVVEVEALELTENEGEEGFVGEVLSEELAYFGKMVVESVTGSTEIELIEEGLSVENSEVGGMSVGASIIDDSNLVAFEVADVEETKVNENSEVGGMSVGASIIDDSAGSMGINMILTVLPPEDGVVTASGEKGSGSVMSVGAAILP